MTVMERARTRTEQGYELLRQGRIEDAGDLARELLAAFPDDVHALVFAGEVAVARGAFDDAVDPMLRAIVASGGDDALRIKLAGLYLHLRRRNDARALALEAAASAQARGDGRSLWQAASIITNCNRPGEAIAHYRQALTLLGAQPGLLYDLAVAQFFTGGFEEAEEQLDRMLALVPQAGHALYLRSTLRRQTPARNHVDALRTRIAAGLGRPEWAAAAWYALAKELEDLGEHDDAFDALETGARLQRQTLQYDIQSEGDAQAAIRAAYTAEVVQAPVVEFSEPGPIFIVGMPRTGTTLVERILVQGGQVKSAGEPLDLGQLIAAHTRRAHALHPDLSAADASLRIDFQALGREYMRGVAEAADAPRFIDKLPVNYMYCGVIRRALPNARIIHLERDPLDSCYAVYKTLFFNAYHCSYDLDELARYYLAYRQTMAHWQAVMPGTILDVRYEDVVADPDGQARRVLEWCGLPWDPDAAYGTAPAAAAFTTASAAQVREPVHARSVGSSRRHLHRLGPLVDRLASAGIVVD
ncbi:sulfotransferase [Luteimonas sp. YGD11-2]|uniref:tetratricopeptide repeat-containing sulfotransferase family protein n=1 Tax=Luteimonas sp. YGD11-2 TaxID=2508168 RepID=UPI00100BDB84|nr:sulfotransferase [Luteimonas sp. YGD11-2]